MTLINKMPFTKFFAILFKFIQRNLMSFYIFSNYPLIATLFSERVGGSLDQVFFAKSKNVLHILTYCEVYIVK